MKKILNRNSKFLIIIIAIISLFAILIANLTQNVSFAIAMEIDAPQYEDKIYCTTTIEDEFDDDCVLVVIDKYNSEINKKYDLNFFGAQEIKSITDLMCFDGNIDKKELLNRKEFRQILKLELSEPSKQNVLNLIHKLENIDGIMWAGPSHYLQHTTLPNCADGTRYSDLWGLNGEYGINAEEAWNITTGSSSVRVGIIDTGVYEHVDLAGNLTEGWNVLSEDTEQLDNVGHGTHVAGIIGATGDNVDGVVGVAPNVTIVPIQAAVGLPIPLLNIVIPLLTEDTCVSALEWAIDNNIDIINFSIGSFNETVALKAAMSNYTGLFVCAAGNGALNQDTNNYEGVDTDETPHYPSSYTYGESFSDRVISVGAMDINGEMAYFSNYGNRTVDIFAPGVNILSTVPTDISSSGYALMSGTSMATPYVTGAAALLYSKLLSNSHNLTRSEISAIIKQTLIENAKYNSSLNGKCDANGNLNVYEALYNLPYRSVLSGFGYNDSWYKWNGKVDLKIDKVNSFYIDSDENLVFTKSTNLSFSVGTERAYNAWNKITSTLNFELKNSSDEIIQINGLDAFESDVTVGLVSNVSYVNRSFTIDTADLSNDTYTLTLKSRSTRKGSYYSHTRTFTFRVSKSCITDGSLITLADGTQKAVEELTGDENLLVWNMLTGTFDSAPILFIDSDPSSVYEVINLTFSDGTTVKVIDEHAFWDFDLNEYVFLRNDAARYIGHYFNKQTTDGNGNMIYTAVQLMSVTVAQEYTTAWSPVTFGHLCYYVNGMLSMPGATEGLINIFEVDPTTMKYDETAMATDVAQYGLFTYEEFYSLVPVPEYVFNAFNGQYLKVAIGKGLITIGQINELFVKYAEFF